MNSLKKNRRRVTAALCLLVSLNIPFLGGCVDLPDEGGATATTVTTTSFDAADHIDTMPGEATTTVDEATTTIDETTATLETTTPTTAPTTTGAPTTTKAPTTKRATTAKPSTTKKPATTKPTTAKPTTAKPTVAPTQATPQGRTVYITPTGKCYHYSSDCAGKNAMARSLSEVTGSYRPCKKCT